MRVHDVEGRRLAPTWGCATTVVAVTPTMHMKSSILFFFAASTLLGAVPQDPSSKNATPTKEALTMAQQQITTALWFPNNAEEAVRFYVSVFKDGKILDEARWGEGGMGPAGSLVFATFKIAGQEFLAINGNTQNQFNESISLVVNCDSQQEIDDYWKKLSVDGKGQCGWTKDKFGVSWQIVPRTLGRMLGDKDPERSRRVGAALAQMGKLDLGKLQRAFDGK
jgi:predicted 3-demethylubiquinone-9 3-methyltransferase (glyoxalase superfamily)